ncbi:MAG: tetratricopeptide repeat protein [Thermoanaerobaculales bacterium]|nr:tetratricopeptide repeat protein [Thermoanaerobaculales bacterium]
MRHILVLVLVLLTLAFISPALAQSTWGRHTDAGEWAFARGDFTKAESEFRAALDIAMSLPESDIRLEESLRNLARYFEHRSDADQAEPLYLLLLAAQEHRLGTESAQLLETLVALARVAIPTGDHPVALDSLERYVAIADATGDRKEDRLRIVLSMLSRVYLLEENNDQALEAQRRATEMTLKNPGLEVSEHAAALESLAQMEFQFGDPMNGEKLVLRAAEALSRDDPEADTVPMLMAGARTAFAAAAFEAAGRLAQQVLTETEGERQALEAATLLGDVHWMKVKRGSRNIQDLYGIGVNSPELEEAAAELSKLDERLSAQLPEEHPDVIQTVDRMILIALMRGDLETAGRYQERAITLQGSATGPSSEATLKTLRTRVDLNLLSPDRKTETVEANSALLKAQEAAWGEDDPRLLPTLKRQYNLLRELKRKKEARPLKKRIRALEKIR